MINVFIHIQKDLATIFYSGNELSIDVVEISLNTVLPGSAGYLLPRPPISSIPA